MSKENRNVRAADAERVLVLDAAQRASLAAIRSLGARGLHVVAADYLADSIGFRSRFCADSLVYPDPRSDEKGFLAWLGQYAAANPTTWILPVSDLTMSLVLLHHDLFPRVLPVPTHNAYSRVSDKAQLGELARAAGFATPFTVEFFATAPPSAGALASFPFPAVVKPALSTFRTEQGVHRLGPQYVKDAAALAALAPSLPQDPQLKLLIQQEVIGQGCGVFGLYAQGVRRAAFAHNRLREKPPTGGVSVLSESVVADPQLLASLDNLAVTLHWHGVMMAEFKRQPDGRAVLIEINGRLWGSLQLAIDCGVDFPALLHVLAEDAAALPAPPAYRAGRRLRWWLGDLDSLYLRLRSPKLTPTWGAKLSAIAQFFAPRSLVRDELLRFGDPRPGLQALHVYLRALR